jgi:hypothetical protein
MKTFSAENINTCSFFNLSDIVPSSLFETISESSSFTYGDNNRSLITASRLLEHLQSSMFGEILTEEESASFEILESLGETYIDLEN